MARGKPKDDRTAQQPCDPITWERAKQLLISTSVVRDPVHGDIRLTSLERAIVDTEEFQRLRHITVLAMVDLVYPGAVHTRFLHSLGTLHVCSEMIASCNNAVKMYPALVPPEHVIPVQIGYYAELLARLAALLHDAAHVPFGHVLQKDAKIFKKDEWQDPWRCGKVFGSESGITRAVKSHFRDVFVENPSTDAMCVPQEEADVMAISILKEVCDVLSVDDKNQESIVGLRYPFVHDLVGNTICADLVDYVQRDMYYAGLTEGLAKRFLQYMAVIPVKFDEEVDPKGQKKPKKPIRLRPFRVPEAVTYAQPRASKGGTACVCRMVMMQYRYSKLRDAVEKPSILAEAIDLIRRRKTIAEKLYFHKTKLVATSMLAAAVQAFGIKSAEQIWGMSDHEVLKTMADPAKLDGLDGRAPQGLFAEGNTDRETPSPKRTTLAWKKFSLHERRKLRASILATNLLERKLFKPIYRVSYHPKVGDPASKRLWNPRKGAYSRFCVPRTRERLIEVIEDVIGLSPDDVPCQGIGTASISCPDELMQLKGFDMLVLSSPEATEIPPLQDTVRPVVKKEIEAIQDGHKDLWCMEVCVDPRVVKIGETFSKRLAAAIEGEIGMRNEIDAMAGQNVMPIDEFKAEQLIEYVQRVRKVKDITHEHYVMVKENLSALGVTNQIMQICSELENLGYKLL